MRRRQSTCTFFLARVNPQYSKMWCQRWAQYREKIEKEARNYRYRKRSTLEDILPCSLGIKVLPSLVFEKLPCIYAKGVKEEDTRVDMMNEMYVWYDFIVCIGRTSYQMFEFMPSQKITIPSIPKDSSHQRQPNCDASSWTIRHNLNTREL